MHLRKLSKETGIIASYSGLLLAVYLFNWHPAGIFLGFLLEFIILLTIYCFILFAVKIKGNSSGLDITEIVMGGIVMVLFQGFLIMNLSLSLDAAFTLVLVKKEIITIVCCVTVFYTIRVWMINTPAEREEILKENIIYQTISIMTTNLSGVILVSVIGYTILLPVLIAMITIRIVLELLFHRHIRMI